MAAMSISGTDKSVYKVDTMLIDLCVLENIDVAVGIFRLFRSIVELYLVIF